MNQKFDFSYTAILTLKIFDAIFISIFPAKNLFSFIFSKYASNLLLTKIGSSVSRKKNSFNSFKLFFAAIYIYSLKNE